MFAAISGAVMSSLASMLNSASTIFTLDLYRRCWREDASQKALLTINDQAVAEGKAFRVGYRRRLEGVDLIAWVKIESRKLLKVSIASK